MSNAEKAEKIKALYKKIVPIEDAYRKHNYDKAKTSLDQLCIDFISISSNKPVSGVGLWTKKMKLDSFTGKQNSQNLQLGVQLIGLNILLFSETTNVDEIHTIVNNYIDWKEECKKTEQSKSTSDRLDGPIFARLSNLVNGLRRSNSIDTNKFVDISLNSLHILRSSEEKTEIPTSFFKHIQHSISLMKLNLKDKSDINTLYEFLTDLDILDRVFMEKIASKSGVGQACNYFRTLSMLALQSSKKSDDITAKLCIELYRAVLERIDDESVVWKLESIAVGMTQDLCSLLEFMQKIPPDSISNREFVDKMTLILPAMSTWNPTVSELISNPSISLYSKTAEGTVQPTDTYWVSTKLQALARDYCDLLEMHLNQSFLPLPSSSKSLLSSCLENMAVYISKCLDCENTSLSLENTASTFQQTDIFRLSTLAAQLQSDVQQWGKSLSLYKYSLDSVKSGQIWPALKRSSHSTFKTALQLVKIGGLESFKQALSFVQMSIDHYQLLLKNCPSEPADQLNNRQAFFQDVQKRMAELEKPISVPTSDLSSPIGTMFSKHWKPHQFEQIIAKLASTRVKSGSGESFFEQWCNLKQEESAIQNLAILVEMESDMYMFYNQLDFQKQLIQASQEFKPFFNSSLVQAKLLLLKSVPCLSNYEDSARIQAQQWLLQAYERLVEVLMSELALRQFSFQHVIEHMMDASQDNKKLPLITLFLYCCLLRVVFHLSSSNSTSSLDTKDWLSLLSNSLDLASSIFSQMISLSGNMNATEFSECLKQNQSQWYNVGKTLDLMLVLKDLVKLHGKNHFVIRVNLLLVQLHSTLQPEGQHITEWIRRCLYSEIGETFNNLGYSKPQAQKYHNQANYKDALNPSIPLSEVCGNREDLHFPFEYHFEWLCRSIEFALENGEIANFEAIEFLTTKLNLPFIQSLPLSILRKISSNVLFYLSSFKLAAGYLHEALLDATKCAELRHPSKVQIIATPLNSSWYYHQTIKSNNAGRRYIGSVWRSNSQFLSSLERVAFIFQLAGFSSESKKYYSTSLSYCQKIEVPYQASRIQQRIKTLELRGSKLKWPLHFKYLENVPSPMESAIQVDGSLNDEESSSNSLNLSSQTSSEGQDLFVDPFSHHGLDSTKDKGIWAINHSIHAGDEEYSKGNLTKASQCYEQSLEQVHSLIDKQYIQNLDWIHAQHQFSIMFKSGTSVKSTAKVSKSIQKKEEASNTFSRMSLSPSKIPFTNNKNLPKDYIGLLLVQTRIQLKHFAVEVDILHESIAAETSRKVVLQSMTYQLDKLQQMKAILESFEPEWSVYEELTLVYLLMAKLEILNAQLLSSKDEQTKKKDIMADNFKIHLLTASTVGTSQTQAKKSTTAKSKNPKAAFASSRIQSPSITPNPSGVQDLLLRSLKYSQLTAAGTFHEEICNLLVSVCGIQNPWTASYFQNLSISNSIQKCLNMNPPEESTEIAEQSNKDDKAISELSNSLAKLLDLSPQADDENVHAQPSNFNQDVFKQEMDSILGTSEDTKKWTICTLSLGTDGKSIVINKQRWNKSPLISRIDLTAPMPNSVKQSFTSGVEKSNSTKSNKALSDQEHAKLNRTTSLLSSSSDHLMEEEDKENDALSIQSLKRSTSLLLDALEGSESIEHPLTGLSLSNRPGRSSRSNSTGNSKTASISGSSATGRTTRAKKELDNKVKQSLKNSLENAVAMLNVDEEPVRGILSSSFETFNFKSEKFANYSNSNDALHHMFSELVNLIRDSDATSVSTENKAKVNAEEWSASRYNLDYRMANWIGQFENNILGHYKHLLLGSLSDSSLEEQIEIAAKEIQLQIVKSFGEQYSWISLELICSMISSANHLRKRSFFEVLVNHVEMEPTSKLENLASLKGSADLIWKKATEIFESSIIDSEDDEATGEGYDLCNSLKPHFQLNRNPLLLILEKNLQPIPFESTPLLESYQVSRIPSISYLTHCLKQHFHFESSPIASSNSGILKTSKSTFNDGIDPAKVTYILDPRNELDKTRSKLLPIFQAQPEWKGIVGNIPQSEDFVNSIENDNLLMFCGHNSGAEFLRTQMIRNAKPKAGGCCVWLMGCESARLDYYPQYDPTGMVLTYLLGGSPSVIGNLWKITSADLDLETEVLVQWLTTSNGSKPLGEALNEARNVCKLRYMNGAAMINFGIPIKTKMVGTLPKQPAKKNPAPRRR